MMARATEKGMLKRAAEAVVASDARQLQGSGIGLLKPGDFFVSRRIDQEPQEPPRQWAHGRDGMRTEFHVDLQDFILLAQTLGKVMPDLPLHLEAPVLSFKDLQRPVLLFGQNAGSPFEPPRRIEY
jgi:hypothetical protein